MTSLALNSIIFSPGLTWTSLDQIVTWLLRSSFSIPIRKYLSEGWMPERAAWPKASVRVFPTFAWSRIDFTPKITSGSELFSALAHNSATERTSPAIACSAPRSWNSSAKFYWLCKNQMLGPVTLPQQRTWILNFRIAFRVRPDRIFRKGKPALQEFRSWVQKFDHLRVFKTRVGRNFPTPDPSSLAKFGFNSRTKSFCSSSENKFSKFFVFHHNLI